MKYRIVLFLAAAMSMVACGGGDSSAAFVTTGGGSGAVGGGGGGEPTASPPPGSFGFDTGVGGTGGLLGVVQQVRSVQVNDLRMETDDAEFLVEGEPGSLADIREGHYVLVAGDLDDLEAELVAYRADLKGPVTASPVAIDPLAGEFELEILGRPVFTSAATRFDDTLAENIVQGDLLEVSGAVDAEGRILATYIGRESALSVYKAVGVVSGLDTAAQTFDLNGLTVDYALAELEGFDETTLADGQRVEVRMAPAGFSPPVSAQVDEVELLPVASVGEGAELEIEGLIDTFTSSSSFSLAGIPVITTSETEFEDGNASLLGLNVAVEVEGVANADGVLVAEEVKFQSDEAIRVEGEITNVTATGPTTGTVETALGITFSIRPITELEDDLGEEEALSLADLQAGDFVEIRGFAEGDEIVAVELEREEAEESALLRGRLTGFDQTAGTVEIEAQTVREDEAVTEYEDAEEEEVSRDAFFGQLETGQPITAEWESFDSLADPADTLSLEDDD